MTKHYCDNCKREAEYVSSMKGDILRGPALVSFKVEGHYCDECGMSLHKKLKAAIVGVLKAELKTEDS